MTEDPRGKNDADTAPPPHAVTSTEASATLAICSGADNLENWTISMRIIEEAELVLVLLL
eukprot:CAMPEP_0202460144 /NCGR_PEP_ID=MMETSP1360-20130828/41848_1 /ASSEMBLY_ACC=CAM_ASM_000848 /TAXON_ID=515479 /ORGANISM="Licmophora paradoxa, Strain CCMP2313" /LENGTH=59 /DNA_ID=CAMNT_0049081661 /DNA_START=100 /DNA_END=279 /DNA_ORIENTATION=+